MFFHVVVLTHLLVTKINVHVLAIERLNWLIYNVVKEKNLMRFICLLRAVFISAVVLVSVTSFAAPFATVLLTGGAGYIGSHVATELLNAGKRVIIVDNFSNSNRVVLERIVGITDRKDLLVFEELDVCDEEKLNSLFEKQEDEGHPIQAVVHFAGLKAVGESIKQPLKYYRNNLDSTLSLLSVMQRHGCQNLIFSSSATVYGKPEYLPMDESHPLSTTNPYGTTKLFIERMLTDECIANPQARFISLRYFNPIGAHPSGLIGESPNGVPNNLMPYILQVARACPHFTLLV